MNDTVRRNDLEYRLQRSITGNTAMVLGAVYLMGGWIQDEMWLQIVAIVIIVFGIYLTHTKR